MWISGWRSAPVHLHRAAIVIMLLGMFAIWRTPTDIFPNIEDPRVAAVWSTPGCRPDEMATRMILGSERYALTTVNDVEKHTRSRSPSRHNDILVT